MSPGPELEIGGDLFKALVDVSGAIPATPEPVVVVSVYLDRLARGYGLSERVDEDPLVRAAVPQQARAQVAYYLPESTSTNADSLRDRLYSVFVEISRDPEALKILNKSGQLGDVELLKAAQIYWNLEADERTPLLPIRPGQKMTANGETVLAGIKVPKANQDFATMRWTARINQKDSHQSSGQGFRNMGARLAVLAASYIVAGASQTPPSLGDAVLVLDPSKKKASIVWPDTNRVSVAPAAALREHMRATAGLPPSVVLDQPGAMRSLWPTAPRVLVGGFAEVGSSYQRRGFDAEIDRLWAEGGDRRVWLRGGPGLGKSYTARRVMQEALARQGDDRDDLLIWVDSADPQAVRQAFSSAVDRMPQLGVSVAPQVSDPVDKQARALLEVLATSPWRWLIVLDNADASGLIEAGLIPAGGSPNGRVLITTLSRDQRITGNGRVVAADLFTPPEAEAFLHAHLDPMNGRPAGLARSSPADTTALAAAVGYHPLALSIAAATITANAMEVADWITEFTTTARMDAAADEPDPGGYRNLIGATWKLALDKASQGLPDGVVERAAMVAGIQDPDGHPTWLWDRDEVTRWVSGGSALARRYGVPVVVQRLIDHGIIEMRSDDTWKGGKLAIHQLAARAVRELASANDLANLAAILIKEWLLHLTEDEAGTRSALRRNIEALTALPGLKSSTKNATEALLGYSLRGGTRAYEERVAVKEGVAEYLSKGGVTGQAIRAYQLATLGDSAEERGLIDEARARYGESAQLYEKVIESLPADDDERGEHLQALGKLYEKLGHTELAREVFAQSLRIYEQAVGVASDWVNLEYLMWIAEIHRALGNRGASEAAIERAEGALNARTDEELIEAAGSEDPSWWEATADQLRLLGRLDQATRLLTLRAEAAHQGGKDADPSVLRKLALIHAESGRWGEAEDVFARVATGEGTQPDDLVLLASIQMHLGRMNDARKTVARAAKGYRSHETGRLKSDLDDPFGIRDALILLSLNSGALRALRREQWDDLAGLYEGLVDLHRKQADGDLGKHEHDLANSNAILGMVRLQSGQPGEAVDPLTRAVNSYQMLTDLDPDDQGAKRDLKDSLAVLAVAHAKLRRPDEAVDHLTRALDIVRVESDPDTEDRQAQDRFAESLVVLGALGNELGKLDEAAYCYTRLVGVRLMAAKHGSASEVRNLARADYLLGSVEQKLGQFDSAESFLTLAVDLRQDLADLHPDDSEARGELAEALAELGTVHFRLERVDEAEHTWTRAYEIRRAMAELDPGDRDAQVRLASSLSILGLLNLSIGRLEDAVDCQTRATNILLLLVDLAPGNPEPEVVGLTILTLKSLADSLRGLGRLEEAEAATARAEEFARKYPDPESHEGD